MQNPFKSYSISKGNVGWWYVRKIMAVSILLGLLAFAINHLLTFLSIKIIIVAGIGILAMVGAMLWAIKELVES